MYPSRQIGQPDVFMPTQYLLERVWLKSPRVLALQKCPIFELKRLIKPTMEKNDNLSMLFLNEGYLRIRRGRVVGYWAVRTCIRRRGHPHFACWHYGDRNRIDRIHVRRNRRDRNWFMAIIMRNLRWSCEIVWWRIAIRA